MTEPCKECGGVPDKRSQNHKAKCKVASREIIKWAEGMLKQTNTANQRDKGGS